MTTTLTDPEATVSTRIILPDVTPPAAADIAAVLDLAADHLDGFGWIQDSGYDVEQAEKKTPLEECRVSADGAIRVAVYGKPRLEATSTTDQIDLVAAVERALTEHLGGADLVDWNDAPERTAGDVKASLRAAAKNLRGEGA